MDNLTFHVQFEGNIVLKDSDEFRDQQDYWDNKNRMNKALLDKMNESVKQEFGKDPLEDDEFAKAKSLRN